MGKSSRRGSWDGGVVVTGESQRGKGPVVPSRLSADEVTGLWAGFVLTA
jgi:hypothetical protein